MKNKIYNILLVALLAISVVPITNIADDINNQYQEEVVSQQDKLKANSFVVDNDEILDRNQVIKLSKVSNNASDFDSNMVTIQQQSIDEINKLKTGGVVEFKIGYQNQEVVVYAIKAGDNVVYNQNEAIVVNDTKIDKENIDNAKQILSPVYIDLNTNTKSDKVSIKQEEDNLVVGDSTLAIKVKIIDSNLASVDEESGEKQEEEIVFNYGYENTNGEFVKIKASENKVNVKNQSITIPSISGYDFVNVYSDNVEYSLNNKEITITSNNSGDINLVYKPIIKIDAYNKLITNEQAQTIKSSDDLISLMNVSCQGVDKSNLLVDLHSKTITEIANNQSGVYPITFSDNKEAKTTVVLTVAPPPGAVEASNGNGWVNGNDATITVSEAKNLANVAEGGEEFSNLFNFQAYCKKLDQYITPDGNINGAFTVNDDYSNITSGKVGKYEISLYLSLTNTQGRGIAEKIVNLYVFPDDAIISDDKKGFLEGGRNFVVKVRNANDYN